MKALKSLLILISAVLAVGSRAHGCPNVANSYLDTDCDGKLTIATLGDSITYGRRDQGVLNIKGKQVEFSDFGGYPIRLEKFFEDHSDVRIMQQAKPGADCGFTLKRFKQLIKKKATKFIDVALVDCGINDYYTTYNSDLTKTIIYNILSLAKRNGIKAYDANLIPVGRDFQQTWQETLNKKISNYVSLNFSVMPSSLLASDGIHPDPQGHEYLYEIVKSYLVQNIGNPSKHAAILKSVGLKKDSDGDGLPNKVEKRKYHTNPNTPDSDGDGVSDYDEALNGTNPLDASQF